MQEPQALHQSHWNSVRFIDFLDFRADLRIHTAEHVRRHLNVFRTHADGQKLLLDDIVLTFGDLIFQHVVHGMSVKVKPVPFLLIERMFPKGILIDLCVKDRKLRPHIGLEIVNQIPIGVVHLVLVVLRGGFKVCVCQFIGFGV